MLHHAVSSWFQKVSFSNTLYFWGSVCRIRAISLFFFKCRTVCKLQGLFIWYYWPRLCTEFHRLERNWSQFPVAWSTLILVFVQIYRSLFSRGSYILPSITMSLSLFLTQHTMWGRWISAVIPLYQGKATSFTATEKGQGQVQTPSLVCLYKLLPCLGLFCASQVVIQCRYGYTIIYGVLLANVIIQSVNLTTLDRHHQFLS